MRVENMKISKYRFWKKNKHKKLKEIREKHSINKDAQWLNYPTAEEALLNMRKIAQQMGSLEG